MNTHIYEPIVLIADDDETFVEAISLILEDEGVKIITASTGKLALKKIIKYTPDLVLLDIGLPDFSGYDICRRIKRSEKYADTTIIFLTGLNGTSDEAKGLAVGAVDYITKPVEIAILRARMRIHLDLKAKTKILQSQAMMDPLTNIPNRRYFNNAFNKEWNRCSRFSERLGLMLIDIDYFKPYNDFYGHANGDRCLKMISEQLQRELRRSTDILARYGGEEFIVLIAHADDADLLAMADCLRKRIVERAIPHQGRPDSGSRIVTISIGCCSVYPQVNEDRENLIRMADIGLYQAKAQGRNRAVIYCDKILEQLA